MNLSGLRGRKVVERVRSKGQRFRGAHMSITYVMGIPRSLSTRVYPEQSRGTRGELFVGTAASTKLDKSAVKRNRMRRRCREALRLAVKEEKTLPSCQLIIVPRSSSLTCAFNELLNDTDAFLRVIQHHKRVTSNQ